MAEDHRVPPNKELLDAIQDLRKEVQDLREEVRPVLEALRTAGSVKKGLIWFSGFIMALTASIFGMKTITSWVVHLK